MIVITEDMILRPGRLYRTPVCWNCRHRIHYSQREIARLPRKPYALCEAGEVVDWAKVRMCNRNPTGMTIYSALHQRCGMWELDDKVWHSCREEVYEYEMRRRWASETKGQSTLWHWL